MYWSEVAQKAIDDGKMAEWSFWQKVDGVDVDQDHNFIFINSFENPEDLDRMDEIWDFKAVFPNKRPDQISTSHLSITKDQLFYERVAFSFQSRPNFIRINYARTTNVSDYLELEQTEWFPYVQAHMTLGSTNVVSWTLSELVMPRGRDIGHEAITIDGFAKLSDSLFTHYGPEVMFPDMDALQAVHHKAEVHVYELIKAVGKHEFEY